LRQQRVLRLRTTARRAEEGNTLSSSPEFNEQQLLAARSAAWHQDGHALDTLEAATDWLQAFGFVAVQPLQLGAPSPSLVEATLGLAANAPTLEQTRLAREYSARLCAASEAVPLNLLGTATGEPDFLVSPAYFAAVVTLRGDKNWKAAPATSGAAKVSTLALRCYEALSAGTAMTVAELVSELGREVTGPAILRALSELWSQLRVLPAMQADGSATIWELTTRRFTKQLKSGANAGLPTALSSLLALYMAQVIAASEDEVAAYFSPLVARSRAKEVLHALLAARQLDTVAVEGKTLVFVPGELPEFASLATDAPADEAAEDTDAASESEGEDGTAITASADATEAAPDAATDAAPRARKPYERKTFTPGKPFAPRTGSREGAISRERKPYAPRTSSSSRPSTGDGERRPYTRKSFGGGDRPQRSSFGDGERKPFTPRKSFGDGERAPRKTFGSAAAGARPFRARTGDDTRPPRTENRERRPFTRSAGGGDRPARTSAPRSSAPRFDKPWEDGARPRKPFTPRADGDSPAPRRSFGESKSFGDRKPYAPRKTFGDGERAPRKTFGDGERKPYAPRKTFGDGERKPYAPRKSFGDGERAPRKTFGDGGERKSFGERKPFVKRDGDKPFAPRKSFGDSERKPYARKSFGEGERAPRKTFGDGGERKSFGERKPFVKRDGDKPFAPRKSFGDGERKPYARKTFGDGERKPFAPRKSFGDGERKSFGGDRKPAGVGRSFGGASKSSAGPKKFGGADKSFGGAGKSFGGAGKSFGGPKKFGSSAGKGAPRTARPGGSFGGDRPAPRKRKSEDEA
jgi:23S rRNA pseudouridine2605 synthase